MRLIVHFAPPTLCPTARAPPLLRELLEAMLVKRPSSRPSAAQLWAWMSPQLAHEQWAPPPPPPQQPTPHD
eukprot:2679379-Prymnesium_polylepis.1